MLGVDEGGDAAGLLGFGDDVQGEGGLAGGFGAEDLDDAAAGDAAAAEGDVEARRAGGDAVDRSAMLVAVEPHDGALAELLFDLAERRVESTAAVGFSHWVTRYGKWCRARL